jgi:hypothetical protein
MAFVTPTDVTVGSVLTASKYNQEVVENTKVIRDSIIRLGFRTNNTTATSATTVGAAADVFATDLTWTADGTSAYVVEGYIPLLDTAAVIGAFAQVFLVNGAGTSIGIAAMVTRPDTALPATASPFFRTFYTPAAGAAAVNLRLVAPNTATATGSSGLPMHLAVYGPPTT